MLSSVLRFSDSGSLLRNGARRQFLCAGESSVAGDGPARTIRCPNRTLPDPLTHSSGHQLAVTYIVKHSSAKDRNPR